MALLTSDSPRTFNKTYRHWWLEAIVGETVSTMPNPTFRMSFRFVRGNRFDDGTWEFSPLADDRNSILIEDVFAFAATEYAKGNSQPAELLEGIIGLSGSIAKEQGVID